MAGTEAITEEDGAQILPQHKTNAGTSIALAPTDLNTAAFIYANGEISTSNEESMIKVHQNLYVLGLMPWRTSRSMKKATLRRQSLH